MRRWHRATFSSYGDLLLRRLRYVFLSGRLSDESRNELENLRGQIGRLQRLLPALNGSATVDNQTSTRRLGAAYSRELNRYGALVKADSRAIRCQSGALRNDAERTRACALQQLSQPRLRVLNEPRPINFFQLRKMVEFEEEATA